MLLDITNYPTGILTKQAPLPQYKYVLETL